MAFPSLPFAYFFLAVATISWAIRRWRTPQKLFLLAASYVFYARWDPKLFGLLFGVSLVDWALGRALERTPSARLRRALVTFGVLANLSLLGVFKLYDFFRVSTAAFADFLGLGSHLPVLEIFLPVGISFYAFQGIAYLVDVYRKEAVEAPPLLDFLLFMAFFPKLLAGPICRSRELLPQIMGRGPSAVPDASRAVVLIASGLFKKMVLASFLATSSMSGAFQMPGDYSSLELVVAIYAYTAEVYLDFSGYTDLARGLALLLGFELPENFRYPYAATNIGEFWKRWHITFSRWLREYVYFPLGGSRRSRARTSLNLVLTFLVCGIWHGSQWTFVVWGLLHGVGLAAYKLFVDLRRARGVEPSRARWWAALGWFTTLAFCAFARVFFRSSDITVASEVFAGLARLTLHGRGVDAMVVLVTALTIALNFVGRPIFERCVAWHARIPAAARPVAWIAAGVVMLAIKTRDVAPYIYFGF
ncbi:MAG: MBOAT family protein [Labilithrix sp.]|nr:MBOAT family protein [Labilithrix sp.]